MKPRLGLVGLGWIGLDRLKAIVKDRAAEVVALCDRSEAALERARPFAPKARLFRDLKELWSQDPGLDGLMIPDYSRGGPSA